MVVNTHERTIPANCSAVGRLIDSLGSEGDLLWPREDWPPMRFDRPLQTGASGGHGPIRYVVEDYEPSRRVQFRFLSPRGFRGTHRFEVVSVGQGKCSLVHGIEMKTAGIAKLSWPCVFRPLHDALIEDCLAKAEGNFSEIRRSREWSLWVKLWERQAKSGETGLFDSGPEHRTFFRRFYERKL